MCRAGQGSLPSQHGSLRSSSGQRHQPCLGNAAPIPTAPHSTPRTHSRDAAASLPSAPHPHPLPKSLEQPGAGSRAQPSFALTAPDKLRWPGSASPSASTWIRLPPVLFAHFPHGKGPHKESRWPLCSSQVGSPVSCSLKVSLFLQPIGRFLAQDITLQLHLLGCSSACGSTDIPRARVLPAAGKPLLTLAAPGTWLHSGLKAKETSVSSPAIPGHGRCCFPHHHQSPGFQAPPQPRLTLHPPFWVDHFPIPAPQIPSSLLPCHGTACGAHSLHLLTSRDHLDLAAHPTNLQTFLCLFSPTEPTPPVMTFME